MMSKGRRHLPEQLQRPATLVEIVGCGRVIVENHHGIRHYSSERILIGTSYGLLEISGTGLYLRCIGREHMCILGKITAVLLMGRNGLDALE